MQIETLVWLIPLPPILAFFTIVLGANRSNRLSHIIAVGSSPLVAYGQEGRQRIGRFDQHVINIEFI